MALIRILIRAVLALVIIAMMTLIIYPLTAASIIFHMLRSNSGPGFILNMLRNIFLNHPDVVQINREELTPVSIVIVSTNDPDHRGTTLGNREVLASDD